MYVPDEGAYNALKRTKEVRELKHHKEHKVGIP
jgi:hypothetical protein